MFGQMEVPRAKCLKRAPNKGSTPYPALTSGVFVCLRLLLPVQLDPIHGSDTTNNQLLAASLRSSVVLFAVGPVIGSELAPSALFQNFVFSLSSCFCPPRLSLRCHQRRRDSIWDIRKFARGFDSAVCKELSPPRAMTSRNDARRWRPRTGRDRQRQPMLSASMSD